MRKMKLYPKGFIFSDESLPKVPNYYKVETFLDTYNYWFDEDVEPKFYEKKRNSLLFTASLFILDQIINIQKKGYSKFS